MRRSAEVMLLSPKTKQRKQQDVSHELSALDGEARGTAVWASGNPLHFILGPRNGIQSRES